MSSVSTTVPAETQHPQASAVGRTISAMRTAQNRHSANSPSWLA